MNRPDDGLQAALVRRGMSRRAFLKFSAAMATALALPHTYAPRIAAAVASAPRLPLIWLRGQACGGDSEAFLRAPNPTPTELLLQFLSVDYIDAIMVAAGSAAEAARAETLSHYRDGYFLVVEGAIPTADGGTACTIAGRPLVDLVREVSAGALATIAVGSCAFDGGISTAAGGQTGAVGAGRVASGRLISLPGCPVNAANLAATIVHYLTFKELPACDGGGRPLFAYGALIHNECDRRAHFEFGEFVQEWGDEGAQKGWCLYRMGCKGPEAFANCASVGFDGGISWPVKAGVGCIGCTMPGFWDAMSPFSRRLPAFVPFLPDVTVDQVGTAAVGAVGGVAAVHAVGSYIRARRQRPAHAAGAEPVSVAMDARVGEPLGTPLPVTEAPPAVAGLTAAGTAAGDSDDDAPAEVGPAEVAPAEVAPAVEPTLAEPVPAEPVPAEPVPAEPVESTAEPIAEPPADPPSEPVESTAEPIAEPPADPPSEPAAAADASTPTLTDEETPR